MESKHETILSVLKRPRENLRVELKSWFDPDEPEGMAKVVRWAIAMRNNNGGLLVVGIDDRSRRPCPDPPWSVETKFQQDAIQGLVTKYASEAFEAHVHFLEDGEKRFVVLEVEPGVRVPVACRRPLVGMDGRPLLGMDRVYVRSLSSNNTASTTEATWKDWAGLAERCFENREADTGRFVRRHLVGLDREQIRELAKSLSESLEPIGSREDSASEYLNDSRGRFEAVVKERDLKLPTVGLWEIALSVHGTPEQDHDADLQFLRLLCASNPEFTGWPTWVDSREFTDRDMRPELWDGVWEAFIWDRRAHEELDFWRLDPGGRFYLLRGFQDDLTTGPGAPKPGEELDIGLAVLRPAEALAVGLEFGRAMSYSGDSQLAYAMRWTGLRRRRLSTWANPDRRVHRGVEALQNEVVSTGELPLDTAKSALGAGVKRATAPLFAAFDGYEVSEGLVNDLVARLVSRRL